MHTVGTLVGKFSIVHNSIQPTILLNGYKVLGGITAIDAIIIGLTPTTLSLMGATLKLAPPRYTKPTIVVL